MIIISRNSKLSSVYRAGSMRRHLGPSVMKSINYQRPRAAGACDVILITALNMVSVTDYPSMPTVADFTLNWIYFL